MKVSEFYLSLIIVLLVVSFGLYLGYGFIEQRTVDRELDLNRTIEETIYNTTQNNLAMFNLQLTELALDCENQPIHLDIMLYKRLSNNTQLPDELKLMTMECVQNGA